METIYLAGGCFWGTQRLMSLINGVTNTECGYANGHTEYPSYEEVCRGDTGHRETVKVSYDDEIVSLETILYIFFESIDPALIDRQGNDRGSQYQSGIYYTTDRQKEVIEKVIASISLRLPEGEKVMTEVAPIACFYPAEDYHQDYLLRKPDGYCHVSIGTLADAGCVKVDASLYNRPAKEKIRSCLPPQSYAVMEQRETEPPFENAYNDFFEEGIYVDRLTGEPLFSSEDKFRCGCGWPAFSRPIDPHVVVERADFSHGMRRTEVISRIGGGHLGHVFDGEGLSDTDRRYCINSAALRFVPKDRMQEEGYGYLLGTDGCFQ